MKLPVRCGSANVCTVNSIDELKAKVASGWVAASDRVFDGKGWPTVAEFLEAIDSRNARRGDRRLSAVVIAFMLAAVATFGGGIYWIGTRIFAPPPPARLDLTSDAYNAARAVVGKNVRQPKFSPFTDPQAGVEKVSGDRWRAWGYVDGFNALGLPVRESWEVELDRVPGDWKVARIRIGSQETASR